MKPYTLTLDIDLPRDRVIALFDDPENLRHWQQGLQSFEHLSGEAGRPGARSKLVYLMNGRKVEILETVTRRELPDAFDGVYEFPGGSNTIENRFIELSPQQTRWESTTTPRFQGFLMKLLGFLFPGMFRSQSLKFMQAFKAFAEGHDGTLHPES